MRPVTKVNPPNYLYFTLASLNNNVPAFGAGAICVVYILPAGFVRSVAWCQNELLQKTVFGQAFPNPSTPLNRARARNIMRQRLAAEYGTARADLTAMIGDYCSFCEMPIAAHLLGVEHRAPKAPYPTYTVWWDNFLLACRDCNSIKASRPARATVFGWLGGGPATEAQLVNEIEARYYWADLDVGTYRVIQRTYWRDTQAAVAAQVQLAGVEYADRNNWLRLAGLDVVRADVMSAGAMTNNSFVEVRIANNGGGAVGTRTIALLGLELQETGRSAERTVAWLTACQNVDNLLTAVLAVHANFHHVRTIVFNAVWNMMLQLAVNAGFYSVWVDVLLQQPMPAAVDGYGGIATLGALFVFHTQAANNPNPLEVFEGTDVTQVP